MSTEVGHVDYPHHPGALYDCPGCESACHCDPCAMCRQRQGTCCVSCVFCASLPAYADREAVRRHYRALRGTVAMYLDGGDVWGSNLGWIFAIAEVLWHHDRSMIPADWDYGHAAGCTGDDDAHEVAEIQAMSDGSPAFFRALLGLGVVLARYDTWLRLAGHNY